MIAFAMSALPLYSLCMWLAMASTIFLYAAVYFAFLMSKVWLSSLSTFATNSLLVGPAALTGLRYFLAPSILGLTSDVFALFFSFWSTRLEMFHQGKPARLMMDGEVHGF